MTFESRPFRVPARCLHPLKSGYVLVHVHDTVEKLKKNIQTSFDIAVTNQILLVNKIRLQNDRTYVSYLKNAKEAEPVVVLDARICESCKVLVVDLINAFTIFDNMDFDGGGDLSRQEIFVGLMNFGTHQSEPLSDKQVLTMINEADKDRNDSIGFFEFWCAICNHLWGIFFFTVFAAQHFKNFIGSQGSLLLMNLPHPQPQQSKALAKGKHSSII
jgi:hypothetical protein